MVRSLKHPLIGVFVACLIFPLAGLAQEAEEPVAAVKAAGRAGVYLVRMSEEPVVAYSGGIDGLKGTRPARGQKINPNHPDVVRYAAYLDARHDQALKAVGHPAKLYDYHYVVNGFAARLTKAQAMALGQVPGVVSVEPDETFPVDTVSTPAFLGLSTPGGLWDQAGGLKNAGEGMIIGIVDTGIWPEHPSFSDRTGENANGVGDKLDYLQIPGWHGKCVPGEGFNASNCNQKLIGCQYFVQAWGVSNVGEQDFLSCRDADSHGTHTASTAGGNHGITVKPGLTMSGVAPRARISAYKVCWSSGPGASALCTSADRAAAIDQAVADGVDVINHSIGATQTSFVDLVQNAFMNAASAGVFVAASGGNSGPTASTVASPSPWVTTVAASTHDRYSEGSAVLGNGASYLGAILGAGVGSAPLIHSSSAGVPVDPTPADLSAPFATRIALCYPGHLDAAKASGKIVLCDRGIIARVDKSRAVKQAGGVGMILRNLVGGSLTLNPDLHHAVPSVHVDPAAGSAIKSYIDSQGATATARITDGALTTVAAPFIAGFSSRGPSRAVNGDILKPDLTAPGVDVIAGTSPYGNRGLMFDSFQGTSMSSPHVAGLGALLKQLHPGWSPMMVKSALMTTATQVLGTGTSANSFAQGAGHVAPKKAVDPGLVYEHGVREWHSFLCGTGQIIAADCAATRIDPSDLNVASIAIGDLPGRQKVRRTVTNVSGTATYNVSVAPPPGVNVVVTPPSLSLRSGESKSYEVEFTRTTATLNAYSFGSMTWSDGTHAVKSPLVVRPVSLSVPSTLNASGAAGNASLNVLFGYAGPFAARPHGLIPATTEAGTVADDPADSFSQTGAGVTVHNLTIPAGTVLARVSLFDEFTDGADDIDLYVYNAANVLVAVSAGATSSENATLVFPAAGNYKVYVHGFDTEGPDANYTLFRWVLSAADSGNMTVTAPSTATIGASAVVGVSWSGLSPAKYLGTVTYHNVAAPATYTTGLLGTTIVRVDAP